MKNAIKTPAVGDKVARYSQFVDAVYGVISQIVETSKGINYIVTTEAGDMITATNLRNFANRDNSEYSTMADYFWPTANN